MYTYTTINESTPFNITTWQREKRLSQWYKSKARGVIQRESGGDAQATSVSVFEWLQYVCAHHIVS